MKNLLYILLASLCSLPGLAQCVATSPANASSSSNNSGIGSFSWSNTSNSQLSDNNHATAGHFLGILSSANSNYLYATNFGFAIPTTATICGVEIEIEASCTGLLVGSSVRDNSVRLVVGGSVAGNNLANAGDWPGSDATSTYGAINNTWGNSLTPAILNASNFGVAISARLSSGLASLFLTPRIDNIRMTVYYDNSAVPIKLKSFSAREGSTGVELKWTTASESGNKVFEIERSADNTIWKSIGSVAGAGDSYTDRHYRFDDASPNALNYYRLRQIDFDNNSELSKIVVVKLPGRTPAIKVSPNPASTYLSIAGAGSSARIRFFNLNAIEVFPPLITAHSSTRTFNIKQLKAGTYFVNVHSENGDVTKNIIVVK